MNKDTIITTAAIAGFIGALLMWTAHFVAIGHAFYQFAQGFSLAELLWFNFKLWVAMVGGGFILYCVAAATTLSYR